MRSSFPYILLCTTILYGCAVKKSKLDASFEMAGRNKEELQKVLTYFKKSGDTLKLKAAVFLIENLPFHTTYKKNSDFDECFDQIKMVPLDSGGRREYFESVLKDNTKGRDINYRWVNNGLVNSVKAGFLIKNINLAFKAWYMIPRQNRANFEEFCNFILPFFSTEEPIEEQSRQFFFDKYHWVYDSLNAGMPFKNVADLIFKDVHFKNMTSLAKYYQAPLSVSQVEKSRLGLCDDGVNYLVNLFRSLGIICNKDMIVQWGNSPSGGHSWIYLKYGSFEYSRDIDGEGRDIRNKYVGESIPKVYRNLFSPLDVNACSYQNNTFLADVTSFYTPTINLQFPAPQKPGTGRLCLNVFNGQSMWRDVANCETDNDSINIHNVGVNCVYIVGKWQNGTFISESAPFYIGFDKKINFFKPSNNYDDSIKVVRKLGLATARNKSKIIWINQLTDCLIEGANTSDFKNAVTLYKIQPFFSTQNQLIQLTSLTAFRYIRFYSKNKESYLANLRFIDNNNKEVTGKIISQNLNPIHIENLFDDEPGSYCGGKDYYVGYEFDKPVTISKIKFQPRNDDNAIRPFDNYTLYCWLNNNWTSFERKEAKDTLLYFYKVPKNCLMFLKDNTRGSEHYVFSMDKEGLNQVWYGFIDGDGTRTLYANRQPL